MSEELRDIHLHLVDEDNKTKPTELLSEEEKGDISKHLNSEEKEQKKRRILDFLEMQLSLYDSEKKLLKDKRTNTDSFLVYEEKEKSEKAMYHLKAVFGFAIKEGYGWDYLISEVFYEQKDYGKLNIFIEDAIAFVLPRLNRNPVLRDEIYVPDASDESKEQIEEAKHLVSFLDFFHERHLLNDERRKRFVMAKNRLKDVLEN